MSNHADMTVIIRANGLLMRADVSAQDAPEIELWRKEYPSSTEAVTDALTLGGPVGKQVWVLDSHVWLGVVELSAGAVAGLSDQALAEPAAYEAETMSGIAPTEAVTSVQRRRIVNQDDEFLVAQAKHADVVALTKAIRSAGGVLAGLGNPAGLPVPLIQDRATLARVREGDWRRVCFWSDSVVLVESIAGRITLLPLGIPPHSDWRTVLAPLLNQGQPVALEQTLVEPGVQVRGGLSWRENSPDSSARWLQLGKETALDQSDQLTQHTHAVCDLADDKTATLFATTWAYQLTAVEPSQNHIMPTLRPPKTPPGPWPAVAVGIIVFVLALSLVLLQRDQQSHRLADVQAELDRTIGNKSPIQKKRKQAKEMQQKVRKKQQALQAMEQEFKALNVGNRSVDRREALASLIAALSSTAAQDVVIKSIDHHAPRHQIVGLATSPEAASRLARELSGQLRYEWQVSPAQIEPKQRAERIVWQFLIHLDTLTQGVARP